MTGRTVPAIRHAFRGRAGGLLNRRGNAGRGGLVLAGILAVLLVVVLILWMNDRESRDLEVEIGGNLPALIENGGG